MSLSEANPTHLPPLVVGTDVAGIWKLYRPLIGIDKWTVPLFSLFAVAAAALLGDVVGFGVGFAIGAVFVLLLVVVSFAGPNYAKIAFTRATLGVVATLDEGGISSTSPLGTLVLPWQAIASVRVKKVFRFRVLSFHLAQGVSPESTGVQSSLTPRNFRRLSKSGFAIGSAGIDVPIQTILDATAAFTDGRLMVN